jgi:hypothetical protein
VIPARIIAARDLAHALLAGWFGRGPQAAAIIAATLVVLTAAVLLNVIG